MPDDYLTRVHNRLEYDNDVPHERRMLEILTEIQDFVNEFSTDCIGINDMPATHQDPACCVCGLTINELAEIERLAVTAYRTSNAATDEPLSKFQLSWCSPAQWRSLGIDPESGLLITTMDLAHTTREVAKSLLQFKREQYRAEVVHNIWDIKVLFQ